MLAHIFTQHDIMSGTNENSSINIGDADDDLGAFFDEISAVEEEAKKEPNGDDDETSQAPIDGNEETLFSNSAAVLFDGLSKAEARNDISSVETGAINGSRPSKRTKFSDDNKPYIGDLPTSGAAVIVKRVAPSTFTESSAASALSVTTASHPDSRATAGAAANVRTSTTSSVPPPPPPPPLPGEGSGGYVGPAYPPMHMAGPYYPQGPGFFQPPLPPGPPPLSSDQPRAIKRAAAGKTWEDSTLVDFPENDYRLFVGNLAKDIKHEQLLQHFQAKFPSAVMAKIMYDKHSQKSRGYGFVSLLDPMEAGRAIREMDQTFLGTRPIKVKRSDWKERDFSARKKQDKKKREKKESGRSWL